MDFDSLVDDSAQASPAVANPAAQQAPQPHAAQAAAPDFDSLQDDSEKYATPQQQMLAGMEGVAQGVAGPVGTYAMKALGADPTEMRLRQEANPWTHGLAEAAGFVGGMFTGASEANLVGKLGEGAAALAGLGEVSSISARLAQGAVKLGAEMTAIQTGDELSKAIMNDPNQTIGSAAVNVGLSGLLGGVTGGAFKGIGMAGASALEKAGLTPEMLQEFKDRLRYRGANLNPNEQMQNELNQNVSYFRGVGDDVGGFNGLKGAAISKVLPQNITPEISASLEGVSVMAQKAMDTMRERGVPESYLKKFQSTYDNLMETATSPESSVIQHFDAVNGFKKELQDFSKGDWGPFAVPSYKPEYDFLQATKKLSRDVRLTLEDPAVWGGEAANLQKTLNASFSKANPFIKQAENKFMSALGDERVVDPQKFVSYVNQAGKATTPTVKQQLLGKFVDAMGEFHGAVENAYTKAGLELPERPGLGALKDSVSMPSMGSKLADTWYDKIGHYSIGNALGTGVGATIIPGISGVYAGRWVLGPVFGAILKPVMEKITNHMALDQAAKFGSNVLKGDSLLTNAAKALFSGGEMIPKHLMPTAEKTDKLDKQVRDLQANQGKMLNIAGDLGHYMPEHAQAMAQHAVSAVNAIYGQRPQVPKSGPLDEDMPPSQDQEAGYKRMLEVAQQPLMAFKHIQDGTIIPQDIATVKAIYPDFYNKMSQELMNHMTNHLSTGEKVPYNLRAGLSLMFGEPIDGTLTPAAIQAAQGSLITQRIAAQASQQSGVGKNKSDKLAEMSSRYQTSQQAAQARQNTKA